MQSSFTMLRNWKSWCRLCAKIDSMDGDSIFKSESIADYMEIFNKYFVISLVPFDGDSSICNDCSSFLEKLDTFKEQCLKTQQMFGELLQKENIGDSDLEAIRSKYSIDTEENKYDFDLPQVHKEEPSNYDFSLDNDPLDSKMDVQDTLFVKIEESPPVRSVPKKRGRPKKSTQSPNKSKSKKRKQSHTKREKVVHEISPSDANISNDHELKKERKRIWNGTGTKEHICSFCTKGFSRPNVLQDHIMTKHRKQELTHVCSHCSKRFVSNYRLKLHEVVHLPEAERLLHPCPYCDKKFTQKNSVDVHINTTHIRNKSFTCEECGKCFTTKSSLTEHQTSHSKERPHQCSFCPKKFKKRQHLRMHEEGHSNEMLECPHCDLKLRTSRTLKVHMLVHSDNKQYKCNFCGNEYKRAKTLKEHLILHTGEKPYECPFCDKTFANGSNCRSHKKKAHAAELAAMEASSEQRKSSENQKDAT